MSETLADFTTQSAFSARGATAKRIPIPMVWERFLGYMYSDTRYLIKGPEGSRKSTFMLKTADMLGRVGPVLYVLAEEKIASGTLQQRMKKIRVNLPRVDFLETPTFEQLDAALTSGKYRFVIIDSVNMMEAPDRKTADGKRDPVTQEMIMHLWDKYRLVYFYVMQMTKDYKEYRGTSAMRHYVDVVIETRKDGSGYVAATPGKHRFRHDNGVDEITI